MTAKSLTDILIGNTVNSLFVQLRLGWDFFCLSLVLLSTVKGDLFIYHQENTQHMLLNDNTVKAYKIQILAMQTNLNHQGTVH